MDSEMAGTSMVFWNSLGSTETGSLWGLGRRECHGLGVLR